jgi:hypothetical protein
LALADSNDLIKATNSSSLTITVPANNTVSFPIKTEIHFVQYGVGQVSFSPASTVTIRATPGLKTREQWSMATLIKIDTNEWVLTGDLTA